MKKMYEQFKNNTISLPVENILIRHSLLAPLCAYFYKFKDYFTLHGEYPIHGNRSISLASKYEGTIPPFISNVLRGTKWLKLLAYYLRGSYMSRGV